ncbi:hypothetical protein [Collimonas silvisoli]|uniref:hypothetical protein n=1 Tax=Collimonas silvisoli TaxID=2825884 RepID=UPI001B8B976B|nr:hypothetical protein [Collimonas silvisoli]
MNIFQEKRFTENKLSAELVSCTEVLLSAPLNEQLAETHDGVFDVVLNGSVKPTHKALSQYFADGIVVFHSYGPTIQDLLKEFSAPGGGINLSAVRNTDECPKNIPPEQWEATQDMVKQVFCVLGKDGLIPMEKLVADTQRSFGYGVTRKKRGLGVACYPDANSPAVVADIMLNLIDQLKAMQQPA